MTDIAVITANPTSGKFRAMWLSEHGGSHGVVGDPARDPIEALRHLADALERNDERLAMLADIDSSED